MIHPDIFWLNMDMPPHPYFMFFQLVVAHPAPLMTSVMSSTDLHVVFLGVKELLTRRF